MFVHTDVLHILLNLVVQIFLGFALELRHRWWRVLLVYVSGVISASIGNSIMEPGYCLRGASGGVYAIISAHIAATIMVRDIYLQWIVFYTEDRIQNQELK